MIQRMEAEITQNWNTTSSPLLSIVCITYNQEGYIDDAISGFLKQETRFPFEIIIHDDASTDNTPAIIKKYMLQYPNLIRAIFQKENQFSQPNKNPLLIATEHAKGKYIAVCEGDDYWIDPLKLQIQLDEMQKQDKCEISFHPAVCLYSTKQNAGKIISDHGVVNKIFTTRDVILAGARFCPTASFIIKKSVFESLPSWFLNVPIGDYFLQILASLNGGILYISRKMSVYRIDSVGSWSEKIKRDENYSYNYLIKILNSIENMNLHTHYKYQNEFDIVKRKVCFSMCKNTILTSEKRKEIFEKNKGNFNFKNRVLWYLMFRNIKFSKFIYNMKILPAIRWRT